MITTYPQTSHPTYQDAIDQAKQNAHSEARPSNIYKLPDDSFIVTLVAQHPAFMQYQGTVILDTMKAGKFLPVLHECVYEQMLRPHNRAVPQD